MLPCSVYIIELILCSLSFFTHTKIKERGQAKKGMSSTVTIVYQSYSHVLFFVSMKIKTTHNLQFSMPFAAEMDIKSSGSSYERH